MKCLRSRTCGRPAFVSRCVGLPPRPEGSALLKLNAVTRWLFEPAARKKREQNCAQSQATAHSMPTSPPKRSPERFRRIPETNASSRSGAADRALTFETNYSRRETLIRSGIARHRERTLDRSVEAIQPLCDLRLDSQPSAEELPRLPHHAELDRRSKLPEFRDRGRAVG